MIKFNWQDESNFQISNEIFYIGYGWSDLTKLSSRINLQPYNSSFVATYTTKCSLDHAIEQVEEIMNKLFQLNLI